jgi:hypothetical protein
MAFRRIRKLARRIRSPGGATVGSTFGPEHLAAFIQVEPDGEAAFQLVGAALVSTWEVGLTEIGRAFVGKMPQPERNKLVARVSDALVPLQQSLQTASHSYGATVKQAVQTGRLSGELSSATALLAQVVQPLAGCVDEGWTKTTEYLAPIFDALLDGEAVASAFAAGGPELAQAFSSASSDYAAALAALPQSSDLAGGLAVSLQDWQRAVCRAIELIVFERMGRIAQAAQGLPEEHVH